MDKLKARSYHNMSSVIKSDIAKMLERHTEAFDVLIFPARSGEYNEVVAINKDEETVTAIESAERRQSYDEVIRAKAIIANGINNEYNVIDSALSENFQSSSEALLLRLSVDGIRKYSLIQWLERSHLDDTLIEERTVYVHDLKSVGHSLAVGVLCVCYPLFAKGEIPEFEQSEVSESTQIEDEKTEIGVI